MNATAKTLLFLVLIAAAVAVFLVTDRGGDSVPPTLGEAPVQTPEPPAPAAPIQTEPVRTEPPAGPTRTEIVSSRRAEECAQGVRGRVIDPDRNPPAPTKVYLMEAPGTDLFRQLMLANKGIRIPPLAQTETDADGKFHLGLEQVDPTKRYEVRVVSERFVDLQVPPLVLKEAEWFDLGELQLQRGTTLWGRVTIEGSNGLPVPDARVLVAANNFLPSLSPTPGREDGIEVKVDHTGTFRIDNAPASIVNVAAVAPNFARMEKQNIALEANAENQVMFELPPGLTIAGLVTDAQGVPVAGAKIETTAISNKTPARGASRSDQTGRFEVIGLVDGPYLVTAVSPGFVRWENKPVNAGDTQLQVVLEKQGEAHLRVFDKHNRQLSSYTVTVKTHFPGQEQFGNTDIPPKQARAGANGITAITGLDPGNYVFQVDADGHCKAFSDPFQVALGAEPPLVEVHMTEGGVLEGTVADGNGRPVANVRVQTMPNDLDENPFTTLFQGMIPYRIAKAAVTTDAAGRYRFTMLNGGTYQLKLSHPDYFEVFLKGNIIEEGKATTVPPLTMERGTMVTGEVRVDGAPAGQVKVTISSAADPESPVPSMFNCEAITDNQGQFAMGKRVPPGRYQIMAARQTLANPLLQIADFHRTRQEITLGRGQEKFFLAIALPSQ